ncbi:MAG: proton-conducting transporter membrane subunit [Planctomycetota bacterium]|nr:proton-conducting transporter membrane subunit [Planctomycetota bacterium]
MEAPGIVEAAEQFWQSLADNIVLLLVVMPLVGAGLVRLMKSSGPEPVYFTGLVNFWLTAGLAVIMVVRFEPGQPDKSEYSTKMTSSLSWLAEWERQPIAGAVGSGTAVQPQTAPSEWRPVGPDVRLSVGVNRFSLWFLVLTVATTLAVFRSVSPDDPRLVSKLSWLLLTESAMLGTFAAQDVILLAICCQVSTLGLFFLVGQGGDPDRHEAARRFLRTQTVSGMLLMAGFVGVAVCHWWMQATVDPQEAELSFSLRRIIVDVPKLAYQTDAAHDLWTTVSPWLFVVLCCGLVLRLPIPPLHHWWFRISERADSRIIALMAVGYLPLSFYAVVRIIVPLFPELVAELAPRLVLWILLSAVILALSALAMSNLRRKIATAGLCSSCVAFGVAFFGERSGIQGGLLLTIAASGSLALLHLSCFGQHINKLPMLLGFAGLAAIPLSGSFWGEILILETVFRRDSSAAFFLIFAAFCVALSLRQCWQEFAQPSGVASSNEKSEPSIARHGILNVMPLALVLVAAAVTPQWIVGPPRTIDAESTTVETDTTRREFGSIVNGEVARPKSLAKSTPNAE